MLALLLVPVLALPQLKENFDVLHELPAGAESRQGYDTLSRHLAEGQLMPLTVLVQSAGGSQIDLISARGLGRMEALGKSIAAVPNVQSVRSLVDPLGQGKVSDMLRPAVQLPMAATAFRKPPSADLNVQLGDASVAGIQSTAGYVGGLGGALPNLPDADLRAANVDLETLVAGLVDARKQALVTNQLDAIVVELRAAAGVSGGSVGSGAAAPTDAAVQLAALKAYLAELGAARPSVKSEASYESAQKALGALAVRLDPIAYGQLIGSIQGLSAWFAAQPTSFYFAPASLKPGEAALAAQQAMAAARLRLPVELDALAAAFTASDLYAPPDLRAAYVSADGTAARLYVTTATNPYDTNSFETVRELRTLLGKDAGGFGTAGVVGAAGADAGATSAARQAYVGGATAEFTDVQDTISADFLRVAAITIIGILIVLILLLRAIVAPVYLVLTVLLSYATSLSIAALILQHLFGQAGVNYFIPLMVFVLLVALGSDYNIFLMSRVREESSTRELLLGIRVASARTGTVITSAGLILAGTFGALVTSPLQLLFQVGLAVGLGVLIDTFVVRSLLVPALTAFIGERAWWPFHRRPSE